MSELSTDRLPDLDRGRLLSLPAAFPGYSVDGILKEHLRKIVYAALDAPFQHMLITVEQCLHLNGCCAACISAIDWVEL
jgi:hypothetical protein